MTYQISNLNGKAANRPLFKITSLKLKQGENLFIHGPSGCGKSTLLNLITGILAPTQGVVDILGTNIHKLNQSARDQFRVDHMGIVFQQFNLIPYLNVFENITLPCTFSHKRKLALLEQELELLDESKRLLCSLGLDVDNILTKNVTELSTGQQQRVAAARALIGSPEIIIADEPTSALDQDTKNGFIKLLFNEAKHCNSTVLFVSHDLGLSNLFDKTISFSEINALSR